MFDFIKLERFVFDSKPELKDAFFEGYGKKIILYRLCRHVGFLSLMIEAGNKEMTEKAIDEIKELIRE